MLALHCGVNRQDPWHFQVQSNIAGADPERKRMNMRKAVDTMRTEGSTLSNRCYVYQRGVRALFKGIVLGMVMDSRMVPLNMFVLLLLLNRKKRAQSKYQTKATLF